MDGRDAAARGRDVAGGYFRGFIFEVRWYCLGDVNLERENRRFILPDFIQIRNIVRLYCLPQFPSGNFSITFLINTSRNLVHLCPFAHMHIMPKLVAHHKHTVYRVSICTQYSRRRSLSTVVVVAITLTVPFSPVSSILKADNQYSKKLARVLSSSSSLVAHLILSLSCSARSIIKSEKAVIIIESRARAALKDYSVYCCRCVVEARNERERER